MELLTFKETADLLRLKENGLRTLVYNKKIPFIKKYGRLIFERAKIEAWLKEGEVTPPANSLQSSTPNLPTAA